MNMRTWQLGAGCGLVAMALTACAPKADEGECSVVDPCERGEECDVMNAICEPLNFDTTSTENPAPANFTGKVVPMFRGQVCTVREVAAGTAFPVRLDPCFHPCLDVTQFRFKHSWECVGSSCSAFGVMWIEASSAADGCPADAFGQFDPGLCVYDQAVDFSINATLGDGTPVEGMMQLEVPFVTNADATDISGRPDDTALIKEKIHQYPIDQSRIAFGQGIRLLRNGPTAAADCGDNNANCECTQIGF